jgi:ribonuclease HI
LQFVQLQLWKPARHYDHATNNAMEIRAVVEALRNLPAGMHGITQWLPNGM